MRWRLATIAAAVLVVTACGSSPEGTTAADREELERFALCGYWEAVANDASRSDAERADARDRWVEGDCPSVIEGGPTDSSASGSEQSAEGAMAFVSDPSNGPIFEAWGQPGPLTALDATIDGDCSAVAFESAQLKQAAADMEDPFSPWTVFLRWEGTTWEPVSITGAPDGVALLDGSSDLCVG